MNELDAQILNLVKSSELAAKNPMAYSRTLLREYAIEQLNKTINSLDYAVKYFGFGNPTADILVLYDPYDTDKYNLPDFFKEYDIDINLFYFFPTICGRNSIIEILKRSETKKFNPFIRYILDVIYPKRLILLGNVSLNRFQTGTSINMARGKWIYPMMIPTMSTYTPIQIEELIGQISPEKRKEMINSFVKDINTVINSLSTSKERETIF